MAWEFHFNFPPATTDREREAYRILEETKNAVLSVANLDEIGVSYLAVYLHFLAKGVGKMPETVEEQAEALPTIQSLVDAVNGIRGWVVEMSERHKRGMFRNN